MKEAPNSLNVLYFGIYSKGLEYPRNNNLIRSLRLNKVNVVEAHFNLAGSFRQRIQVARNPLAALYFLIRLVASYGFLSLKFAKVRHVNAIIVGHPGYFHIHLARLLRNIFQKNALLIFDVFIPLYDALVEDRKLIKTGGLVARVLHRFERSCCKTANLFLIDTTTHCQYLIEEYALPRERVCRIFVGPTIRDAFGTLPGASGGTFKILYFGTYIPLHGVGVILEAARKLNNEADIRFCLVGSGQLRSEMEQRARNWNLKNVVFQDWVSPQRLGELIRSYDLSLGVFGATPKAERVIPSKVFDICAAGVPFITADTPAIREVFIHGENAYLVPQSDPGALADAILYLKTNPELRERIAEKARRTGEKRFSLKQIGCDLVKIIHEKIHVHP